MNKFCIIFCGLLLLSCNQSNQSNQSNQTEREQKEETVSFETIDPKKQFLIENGFKEDADISDAQMKDLKFWIESGTFKEISICEAFYDLLPMKDKEGREYLKKFKLPKGKDVDELSVFLNSTGWAVCYKYPKPRIPKTKEEVESLFSSVDGSLPDLVDKIKLQMKDPSSFKHIETSYSNIKSKIIVKMKYSGLNSFGVEKVQDVTATVDFDGKVIKIYKNE
jgi:hypothetical protein